MKVVFSTDGVYQIPLIFRIYGLFFGKINLLIFFCFAFTKEAEIISIGTTYISFARKFHDELSYANLNPFEYSGSTFFFFLSCSSNCFNWSSECSWYICNPTNQKSLTLFSSSINFLSLLELRSLEIEYVLIFSIGDIDICCYLHGID